MVELHHEQGCNYPQMPLTSGGGKADGMQACGLISDDV